MTTNTIQPIQYNATNSAGRRLILDQRMAAKIEPDLDIVGFTLTVVNDSRRFLSQYSTNFHEILHTLFSIHVVTTLNVSRSFDKYFAS